MGSSWTLLTLFLVYSYPNERLGLLSRRLLALDLSRLARPRTSPKPLPKASACSRPPLGLVYATPIERLYYAYATQNYRATLDSYDSPTYFLFYYKSFAPSFPLPTTLLRPSNDLATKSPETSRF